jgi:hypothetical protein
MTAEARLERLLQEIETAEDDAQIAEIVERFRDELDALPPRERERANAAIEDAIRERRALRRE